MSILLRINSSLRVGGKSPISRLRNRQEIAVEPPRPRETRSRAALAGPGHFACGFLGCSVPFIFIKACFLLLLQTQSQDEFSACSSGAQQHLRLLSRRELFTPRHNCLFTVSTSTSGEWALRLRHPCLTLSPQACGVLLRSYLLRMP